MAASFQPPSRPIRSRRRPAKIVGLLFLGLCVLPLGLGLFFLIDTLQFLSRATATTTGAIVSCQYDPTSTSSACTATVAFTTARGQTVTFTTSIASSAFAVGQQQPVAYDPGNPQDARIATFLTLWFVPTLLLGIGVLFLVIGGVGTSIGFFWRRQVASS